MTYSSTCADVMLAAEDSAEGSEHAPSCFPYAVVPL